MDDGSELDSYITIAAIENGLKDNDHKIATEIIPVQLKTPVQAGDLPHLHIVARTIKT